MSWNIKLSQLNDVLGDLVYSHQGITRIAQDAGLKPSNINYSGNSLEIWNSIINEFEKRHKTADLIKAALARFPDNAFLVAAANDLDINYSLTPDIDKISKWKAIDVGELEALTMNKSTLLPISFLEKGISRSKSVAKIEIKTGSDLDVGTGFLIKLFEHPDLFFITNYHVISDSKKFKYTRIIFNFELDMFGDSRASESFQIKPDGVFISSPIHEFDVSVFQLQDPDGELIKYGYIQLGEFDVDKNEYVNIIQHPGGQWKQLALYHNIVTSSNERIIQYLTDTLKGSSGAPIFDSDWNIVGIHHSGGNARPGEDPLPFGFKSRNEGIKIIPISKFIASHLK